MARFDRWPWRKLYVPEEGAFANLPVLCRGLAAELLKIVDDEGTLIAGKDGLEATVARRLGAHRQERQQIRAFLALLQEDGYLVSLGGGAWQIRNFVAAQARQGLRTPPSGSDPSPKLRGSRAKATAKLEQSYDEAATNLRGSCAEAATAPGELSAGNSTGHDARFSTLTRGGALASLEKRRIEEREIPPSPHVTVESDPVTSAAPDGCPETPRSAFAPAVLPASVEQPAAARSAIRPASVRPAASSPAPSRPAASGPAASRPDPGLAALGAAWSRGMSAGLGRPCTAPGQRWDLDALGRVAAVRPELSPGELAGFVQASAEAFGSTSPRKPTAEAWEAWLNAGGEPPLPPHEDPPIELLPPPRLGRRRPPAAPAVAPIRAEEAAS